MDKKIVLTKFALISFLIAPAVAWIKIGNTSILTYVGVVIGCAMLYMLLIFNKTFVLDSFNKIISALSILLFFLISIGMFSWFQEIGFKRDVFIKNFLIFLVYILVLLILNLTFARTNGEELESVRALLKKVMYSILFINALFIIFEVCLSVFLNIKVQLPWYTSSMISPVYRPPGFFPEEAHFGEYFIIYLLLFVGREDKFGWKEGIISLGLLLTGSIICFFSVVIFLIISLKHKNYKRNLLLSVIFLLILLITFMLNGALKYRISQLGGGSLTLRFYKSFLIMKGLTFGKFVFGFGFGQSALAMKYYSGEYATLFNMYAGYYSGIGSNLLMIGIFGALILEISLLYMFIKAKGHSRGFVYYLLFLLLRMIANINLTWLSFWLVFFLLSLEYYRRKRISVNEYNFYLKDA